MHGGMERNHLMVKLSIYKNGFIIQPKGLERIDYLQKENRSNGKNVFVSMSFSYNTKQTREALRSAIVDAEFSPEFIDEIIHNKLYDDEKYGKVKLKDIKGTIEFKDVSFHYREDEDDTLTNFNLKIEPNKIL